jgi:hypothetical integral membrane protein (TIGR02206 family)
LSDLPPFAPFGRAHFAALGVVGLAAVSLVLVLRARPRFGLVVRLVLVLGIVGLTAFELRTAAREGWLGWKTVLPFELCDAALVLTVVTLLWPRRPLAEVVYFWAASGTVLAMLTPDLQWSFPRWEFVVFFGLHGLVFAAAMVLVFAFGLRPTRGAAWRVFGITAAWTAFVALVNFALGTNFMYLRHKPFAPTALDHMGPWPFYVVSGAVVALVLFQLLALPFRREWRAARGR